MLCAVQIFNSPNISFKSESFIVLAMIAWTYMLHAYYRSRRIDYRYFQQGVTRRKFDKTKRGSYKYWELERCLNDGDCPIDAVPKANLKFLIGLRHEIEHQMTTKIDDYLSARFQACCLNYNRYIAELFGQKFAIDKHLSFSLQFSAITEEHAKQIRDVDELPKNIAAYIKAFDSEMSDDEFGSSQFAYRVFYTPKTANRKGQADKVIEFLSADSEEAKALNKEYVIVKDRERPKHRPGEIVNNMKRNGFPSFSMHWHTELWHEKDGKNPAKGFGVDVAGTWYWYDSWVTEVKNYCISEGDRFR